MNNIEKTIRDLKDQLLLLYEDRIQLDDNYRLKKKLIEDQINSIETTLQEQFIALYNEGNNNEHT